MLGVSWSTPARLSLACLSVLGIACAGGDPGGGSGNPFTTQPANTTPGGTAEASGTDPSVGTEPTGASNSESATSGVSETSAPTSAGPSGDPSGPTTDPSGTTTPDPDCVDMDGDAHGEGCELGADCDDTNFNAYTMCETCVDDDTDNYWTGCDQYGPDAPGPDCDDTDPAKTEGMNCTCPETPADKASDLCSEGMAGKLGPVAEGGTLPPIKGSIPKLGGSDWYWVEFPEAMAMGARPNAGKIVVNFSSNPGDPMNPDYRFEVFRACGQMPFETLGASFGPNTPPAREWEFFDAHVPPNPNPNPNPNYKNDIAWPAKVYVRVTRVANDGSCSEYVLQVARQPT